MGNLIRMDLYRIRRTKAFWVCLILAFLFALSDTPLSELLALVGRLVSDEITNLPTTAKLSEIIGNPFPFLNAMLAMLCASSFFYMDMENGYIKNIAGQMPKKGFSRLSRFLAMIPCNLLFMLVGIAGNLLGTVFFRKIEADSGVANSLVIFLLKFLLIQSICAILVLVISVYRNKSLGTVLSVLFGTGLLALAYLGIDAGLNKLFPKINFAISDYMPDQLLGSSDPGKLASILVAAITTFIFLTLAIRVFDKKDVK